MSDNSGIKPEYKYKIIAVISALIPEAHIYLFGSRATGTYTSASDIDLALDAGKKIEPHWRVGEARDVLAELFIPYSVDLLDSHCLDRASRERIVDHGILWKN